MYACVCARALECDVRAAIRCGAQSEEEVGQACDGAGTNCGTCLDRICDLIEDERAVLKAELATLSTPSDPAEVFV